MDTMPSAQFRKVYARLEKPTVVTVNGHVIGTWLPAGATLPVKTRLIVNGVEATPEGVVHDRTGDRPMTPKERQEARDAILRRMNKGG